MNEPAQNGMDGHPPSAGQPPPDPHVQQADPNTTPPGETESEESLLARLKRYATIAAIIFIALFIGALFIPNWWAHRIGDVVDGRYSTGLFSGLVIGFVCTLLPATLFVWAWKSRVKDTLPLVLLALGGITALPNLLTLSIVVGTGSGAKSGRETMDIQGTGFRGGTLFGFLFGLGLVIFYYYSGWKKEKAQRRAAEV